MFYEPVIPALHYILVIIIIIIIITIEVYINYIL